MIFRNLFSILKAFFFQFLGITVLISFLLFLLNILVGLSFNIQSFSEDLKHRLGIYFYINEYQDKKDETYSKAIELKSKLEDNGLDVEFYSKDDALKLLEKRMPDVMPDVIKNLKQSGMKNPLPPTLYVIFDTQKEYTSLKSVIKDYQGIIHNKDDLTKGKSFSDQKERISNVINLTNFFIYFSYFLIIVLLVIILSFLVLIIKISFYNFYKQIEVEKLLGAFYRQIKAPFLLNILMILVASFAVMIGFMYSFLSYLNNYFTEVFDMKVLEYIFSHYNIYHIFGIEFIVVLILSFIISNFFLNRLIKKV